MKYMEWKNERKEQFESHMLLHYGHRLYSNINERKLRHKNLCNRQYCNNNFFFSSHRLFTYFLKSKQFLKMSFLNYYIHRHIWIHYICMFWNPFIFVFILIYQQFVFPLKLNEIVLNNKIIIRFLCNRWFVSTI